MKKIDKDYSKRPGSLKADRKPYQKNLQELAGAGKWMGNTLYASDSVKDALRLLYGDKTAQRNPKCAFCELRPLGSPLQVEHFRPKEKIEEDPTHPGYYWLGIEWSNLLYACANCNTSKSNHFPLKNGCARVQGPSLDASGKLIETGNHYANADLMAENPLLINPEVDNPADFFFFKKDGTIQSLEDNYYSRGKTSIRIYSLNRDELTVSGRKKLYDDINDALLERLKKFESGQADKSLTLDELDKIIRRQIVKPFLRNEAFSAFFKFMFGNFDLFFLPQNHVSLPSGSPFALLKRAFVKIIHDPVVWQAF